jgi:hypothetical protein
MKYLISILIFSFIISCDSQEKIESGLESIKDCKAMSPFVKNLGFNASSSAFTTSDKTLMGIALIDINGVLKPYQHPSWINRGKLGPIAIDEQGNVYATPVPFVNVLDAQRHNQNVIYKIDGSAGEMNPIFNVADSSINLQNAHGFVGLYYDCSSQLLYASSLQGSNKQRENGIIYCLDVKKNPAEVISKLEHTDAMGICIAYFNNNKYLFYGSTRTSLINRVQLKEDGSFSSEKIKAFSIAGIGNQGDDRAKKLRTTVDNKLQITGMPFYYNLTAPTETQESKYLASYNLNTNQWSFDGIDSILRRE